MAARVNRESFLRALESVQPGLSPREIVEQSSCFVFADGQVMAYNDEVACRTDSGLPKTMKGAVQAAPLLAILRKMVEDEIDLNETDGELVIVGKRRRAGIRMEAEIALPIDKVEQPKKWSKLHEDFGDAINIVQQCAGRDESMFRLTCVHITPKWLESCDNQQICRWRLETGIKQATLVRQSAIKHVASLGMVEFSEGENWLHFKNPTGLVFSCRRYLEEFPSLSKFFKVEGTPMTLPKGLVDAAEKAAIFSSENTDNNYVTVELRPDKVKIRGQGVSGWYSELKKIDYKGTPMSFNVPPGLLIELVKRHNDCFISADRLKVDGGSYVYVASLHQTDNGEAKEEGSE